MHEEFLLERRQRTHAIVEGALLGDIALVFLLMRAYLPVLFIRPILFAFATVPIVMLLQRRGVKVTILSGVASYLLLSALVGPLLAFAAVNVALAGGLIGIGRRIGFGAGLNTLIMGPLYGVLDYLVPTVISVIVFRYPVHDLIKSAQNSIDLSFRLFRSVLSFAHAPPSLLHQLPEWQRTAVHDWQVVLVVVFLILGSLNIYLGALVSEVVLNQVPEATLSRQRAA